MEEREVDQPLKASSRKLDCSLGASGDQDPLPLDQLRKQRDKKQLTGVSPVENESRGQGGEREDGKDIFEKEFDGKMKERAEEIVEDGFKIRIEYGNYNCKGSGKHRMPIGADRMVENDYKHAGRELEIKISDDPGEFEEPELYESMRLLREAEGSREGGRKRRGGGGEGGASANAKRPTLNLEKMLKV